MTCILRAVVRQFLKKKRKSLIWTNDSRRRNCRVAHQSIGCFNFPFPEPPIQASGSSFPRQAPFFCCLLCALWHTQAFLLRSEWSLFFSFSCLRNLTHGKYRNNLCASDWETVLLDTQESFPHAHTGLCRASQGFNIVVNLTFSTKQQSGPSTRCKASADWTGHGLPQVGGLGTLGCYLNRQIYTFLDKPYIFILCKKFIFHLVNQQKYIQKNVMC